MMKCKKLFACMVCAGAVLLCSAPTYAIDGIIWNISGGYSYPTGLPSKSAQGASSRDIKFPRVYQILAGYSHAVNPYIDIGVLGGYANLGQVDYVVSNVTYTTKDDSLLFLGETTLHAVPWHISAQFLAGLARNGFSVNSSTVGKVSTRISQPYLGINLLYDINLHFGVGLGYSRIFGDNIDDVTASSLNNKAPTMDSGMLILQYIF